MIFDLAVSSNSVNLHCDFCIVGTGPAGTSLARSLIKKNKNYRIVQVEGGSLSYDQFSNDLYSGSVVGDNYIDLRAGRSRFLGGSSNCWNGMCRELDESDFDNWPISINDLKPYLTESCDFLNIVKPKKNILIDSQYGLEEVFYSYSRPPMRISEKFKSFFEKTSNFKICINSNLVDASCERNSIKSVKFLSRNKNGLTVNSRFFIFSMGGIENSRMLEWINYKNGYNISPKNNLIGRYWMDHPHFTLGEILTIKKFNSNRYYAFTPEIRSRYGINNCGLRVLPAGEESTRTLIKNLICTAPNLGLEVARLFKNNLICGDKLRASWEQAPSYNNFVSLSPVEFDYFNIPKPVVHFRKSDIDIKTARLTAILFGEYINKSQIGYLKINQWLFDETNGPADDEIGGFHHMGGTRMSNSKLDGVVDKNCKVFGSNNLFIAGSSVFPSGGYANPTLTIVQLSLRLADHLNQLHRQSLL